MITIMLTINRYYNPLEEKTVSSRKLRIRGDVQDGGDLHELLNVLTKLQDQSILPDWDTRSER